MKTMTYAGIGSRSTPQPTLITMSNGAQQLSQMGWKLRSGHADGADLAFESGSSLSEIHLPWASYNRQHRWKVGAKYIVPDITPEMLKIAAAHHPVWDRLSDPVRNLMCRNVTIILGQHLNDPADMVICWTPQAAYKGGTAHGMRVADTYGIPIFNLADPAQHRKLDRFLFENEEAVNG